MLIMAKILLVEDDNNLREIYAARLEAEGYEIATAIDGESALAAAMKEKPDLIMLDVMMPKISGFDVLDILRSTPETKDAKIVMMTALSQQSDRERGERLGANKYLVKSQVTLEDVVATVQELLTQATQPKSPEPSTPALEPINVPDLPISNTADSTSADIATPEPAIVSEQPISDGAANDGSSQPLINDDQTPAPADDSQTTIGSADDTQVSDTTNTPIPEPALATDQPVVDTPAEVEDDETDENTSSSETEPAETDELPKPQMPGMVIQPSKPKTDE